MVEGGIHRHTSWSPCSLCTRLSVCPSVCFSLPTIFRLMRSPCSVLLIIFPFSMWSRVISKENKLLILPTAFSYTQAMASFLSSDTARASEPFRHCTMLLYQQLDMSWGMTKGTYRTNRFMVSPRGTPCYIPSSGAKQVCGAHFWRKRKTNVQGHLYRRRNGILDIHAFVSEALRTSLTTRECGEACALSMT
jgi:hypothetical protein